MTSYEIKMNLELTDKRMKSKLINYLRSTDLVKFARKLPTLGEAESKFVWLYEYPDQVQVKFTLHPHNIVLCSGFIP